MEKMKIYIMKLEDKMNNHYNQNDKDLDVKIINELLLFKLT